MGIKYNPFSGNMDMVVEYLKKVGTVLSPLADGDSLLLNIDSIGSTSTDAFVIKNNTDATAGATVQASGRMRYYSSGWDTDGAVSVSQEWITEVLPISGNDVTSIYRFGISSAGGAYSYPLTIRSDGLIAFGDFVIDSATYSIYYGSTAYNLAWATNTTPFIMTRNDADAVGTFTINNLHASNTGLILDAQWQSISRMSIDRYGTVTVKRDGIQTTSTDALVLSNNTAATISIPVQMSPRINLSGSAFNSVSGLSETNSFIIETLPVTAAGTTSAILKIGVSINSGAYTYPMTLTSGGVLTTTSSFKTSQGNGLENTSGSNYGAYWLGGDTAGQIIYRNINDAYSCLTVNNQQGTGNIQDWKYANVLKAYVDKDGMGYFASIGLTGTRIPSGYFTDLTVTNAISGSITGTAAKATNLVGGNNTTLLGSIPYQSDTDITTLLSPNVTTTKKFITMTGDGTNGVAPSWDTVTKTDVGLSNVENTALSTWAGTTNITTLGTIGTGVWQGTTIKANYLQSAAADLGAADVDVNLSNSNGSYVTNLTLDGTFTGGGLVANKAAINMGGAIQNDTVLSVGWNNSTMLAGTTAARHMMVWGNITELADTAITDIVGLYLNSFTVTAGGGTTSVGFVAGLYIPNAPTVGTVPTDGVYSIFVDAGLTRLDGNLYLNACNLYTDTTTGMQIGTAADQKLGFFGATPTVQSTGWGCTNVTSDKGYDADDCTIDEIADTVGSLIDELKTKGIIGG